MGQDGAALADNVTCSKTEEGWLLRDWQASFQLDCRVRSLPDHVPNFLHVAAADLLLGGIGKGLEVGVEHLLQVEALRCHRGSQTAGRGPATGVKGMWKPGCDTFVDCSIPR